MIEYATNLDQRMVRLEKAEISTRQDTTQTHIELERLRIDLASEFAALHEELALLESATKKTIVRVEQTIGLFRNVVKVHELERLQARLDMWAPESRVTKHRMQQLIDEETS